MSLVLSVACRSGCATPSASNTACTVVSSSVYGVPASRTGAWLAVSVLDGEQAASARTPTVLASNNRIRMIGYSWSEPKGSGLALRAGIRSWRDSDSWRRSGCRVVVVERGERCRVRAECTTSLGIRNDRTIPGLGKSESTAHLDRLCIEQIYNACQATFIFARHYPVSFSALHYGLLGDAKSGQRNRESCACLRSFQRRLGLGCIRLRLRRGRISGGRADVGQFGRAAERTQ